MTGPSSDPLSICRAGVLDRACTRILGILSGQETNMILRLWNGERIIDLGCELRPDDTYFLSIYTKAVS